MLTGVPREGSGRFFNLLLVRTMQGRDGKARRVGILSGSFSHRSRCKGQMQGWGERRHLKPRDTARCAKGPGGCVETAAAACPAALHHRCRTPGRSRTPTSCLRTTPLNAAAATRCCSPPLQPPRPACCLPLPLSRPAARRSCSLRGYPAISRRATSRSRLPRALLPLTEAVLIFGSGRGRVGGGDEGVIGAGVGRAGSEWVWHGGNWLGRLVGWLESVGCWV